MIPSLAEWTGMKSHSIIVGLMLLFGFGCYQSDSPPTTSQTVEKKTEFAEDRAPPPAKEIPFDGDRAMKYLTTLCKIGPRISGSGGMREQQELLKKHFEDLGGKVTFQKFDAKQPTQPRAVECKNLIVTWHPDRKRRVILCGHYDTRPLADQEPLKRDWTKPFVSANDGTSTVAFLMEMAHHMKDFPSKVGVEFVIFDAEEFLYDRDAGDKYFLGSEHFARDYKASKPEHTFIAGILFDLFAGKKAKIKVEGNSHFFAAGLVEDVWRVAADVKAKSFVWEQGPEVLDDHLALNHVGIPCIDIIDFEYEHWHKLSDTPENCSGAQMAEVAKVITVWLQRVK